MRENDITVIIGRKRSGKSTKAREILESRPRRIIIDPMFEHTSGVIVRTCAEAIDYIRPRRFDSFGVVLRALDRSEVLKMIAFLVAGDPERPPLPDTTLFVDEIDKLCSPNFMPEPLDHVVNYGRHFRISLIAVARRARSMHRDITANADRIFIGMTQEPADVDHLREFIGLTLAQRAKAIRQTGTFVCYPDDLDSSSELDGGDAGDREEADQAHADAELTGGA